MIRLYFVLFCLLLNGCGAGSASKPIQVLNAESYNQEAIQAYQNEDWLKAQRLFNKSLSLYQGMDNRQAVVSTYINLVEVYLALSNKELAYKQLKLADEIVRIDGLEAYRPRISLLNALVLMQYKQTRKAESLLQSLLPSFDDEKGSDTPKNIQLVAIATQTEIAFQQNNNESLWVSRYEQTLEKLGNKQTGLDARLLRFQSKLSLKQGSYDEAIDRLQQALELYKKNLSRSGIAGTLLELGEAYQKQGDNLHAVDYFKRSIVVYRPLGRAEKVSNITDMVYQLEESIDY